MPTTRKNKRRQKPKHITARSITLEDAKGKARIFMDAGNGDGYSTICLFGENDRSIQISTTPEGGLYIALEGQRAKVLATLSMSPSEDAGLSIRDRKGCLGTMLGSILQPGSHRLVLFHNGQPGWSTPDLSKPKPRQKKKI